MAAQQDAEWGHRIKAEAKSLSWFKIVLKPLLRYGDFSIFQHGGRRHLGFLKCRNFRIRRVKRIKVHQRAKFRGDRSNRC